MPACLKCRCEIAVREQICPWCGTHQHPKAFNYHRWLLIVPLIALSSWGVTLTHPFLWDVLFHLGFRHSLLNLSKLEQFLEAGDWQQADSETTRLIEQATQADAVAYPEVLDANQVSRLACSDLQMLNSLWLKHSAHQFGFSVQRQLYEATLELASSPRQAPPPTASSGVPRHASNNAASALQSISEEMPAGVNQRGEFLKAIGWGEYLAESPVAGNAPGINFSLSAPKGHLPSSGVFLSALGAHSQPFSTDILVVRQRQCGL